MKKRLPILLLSAALLASCGQTASSEEAATSEAPVSSSDTSSEETLLATSISKISRGLSVGGALIDVDFQNFAVGHNYVFTFSYSDTSDDVTKAVVTTSDSAIASVANDSGTWSFTVHKAGDAVLMIQSGKDGYTYYKDVLHCRKAMSKEEMDAYLISVDHWQSWSYFVSEGTNEKIVFLDGTNATLTGIDTSTNLGTVDFTYQYLETTPEEYYYTIKTFNNQVNSFRPVRFQVDMTGGNLHLMISDGKDYATAAIFSPATAN